MSDGPYAHQRKHPRTPLALLVQYRFNSFEDFLSEYAVNLSPGGMFIRTDAPAELGSMISMLFSLKDGSKLIEGMGRVVRVIPTGAAADQVPGMGVEFVDFDEESSALIRQICDAAVSRRR